EFDGDFQSFPSERFGFVEVRSPGLDAAQVGQLLRLPRSDAKQTRHCQRSKKPCPRAVVVTRDVVGVSEDVQREDPRYLVASSDVNRLACSRRRTRGVEVSRHELAASQPTERHG